MILRDNGRWTGEVNRWPRNGMIKLGIKRKSKNGTFPSEVDYFVFPDDHMGRTCEKAYGKNTKELIVFLPSLIESEIFPTEYQWWGASIPKCTGDGINAERKQEDGSYKKVKCMGEPEDDDQERGCEFYGAGRCQKRASLFVMLPEVCLSGVFQIDTQSNNAVMNIKSALNDIELSAKRFGCEPYEIPCLLRRGKNKNSKGGNNYPLILTVAPFDDIKTLQGKINEIKSSLQGHHLPSLPDPKMPRQLDGYPNVEYDHTTDDTIIDGEIVDLDKWPDDMTDSKLYQHCQSNGITWDQVGMRAAEMFGKAKQVSKRADLTNGQWVEFYEQIKGI